MSIHLDAIRRRVGARLAICDETEVRMFDLLMDHVEQARSARREDPLLETGSHYGDVENAYRRGHNDAMRAETPQTLLYRMRLLVTTRCDEVERGLAELRRNAPRELAGVVQFDLSEGGDS